MMTGDNDVDLDAYRTYMAERGMRPYTIKQRLSFARARRREWGTWQPARGDVATWLSRYNGWTKATYHAHLTSMFNWLVDDGLVDLDPMPLIPRPPTPRPRPRPLSEDDLRRALETAPADVRSWLMLGYFAGLRAHEIAKFRGEDITEHAIYIDGKGGQAWTVPTHDLLWQLALTYPRQGLWFPSPFAGREHLPIIPGTVTNKTSRHFRSIGLGGATHRARHTYGTQLLRGGANLRVVQELLRHASLATTARYLGVDEDEKRDAIGRLGGVAA